MKYKIETAPLVDYYVIVAKDNNTGEIVDTFTLNESGTDMLKLFCQGKDVLTITEEIANMYEAPLDQVSEDVKTFAKKLHKKGLL